MVEATVPGHMAQGRRSAQTLVSETSVLASESLQLGGHITAA